MCFFIKLGRHVSLCRSEVKFTIDMYLFGNELVNTIETEYIVCLFIELGRHVNHGERMNSIDFFRLQVKGQGHDGHH